MEPVGSMSEGEWSSLSGMYNTTEEADFMAQLLANPPLPSDHVEGCSSLGIRSSFWPGHDSIMSMSHPNLFYFQRGNSFSGSNSSCFPTPTSSTGNYLSDSHPMSTNSAMLMEFLTPDAKNTSSYLVSGDECLNEEMSGCNVDQEDNGKQPETGFPGKESQGLEKKAMQASESAEGDINVSENKKRHRSAEAQKTRKYVRSRRNQKPPSAGNTEEESNAAGNGQSTSSSSSEDDSNGLKDSRDGKSSSVSSKENPAPLNSNGKSRASRGTATDPQSLYARKRRERINERLRILQSLVPNGTKVDISTMLEEAVQYVKFLQLQIKLLSSDDMWMYAPIAYNGMSIGLDLNIPTPPKRP